MTAISTRVRLAPFVAALVYLNGTVLLLAVGPWPWPIDHPFVLYGYLVLAHVCLLGGYLTAAFRTPRTYGGQWSWRSIFWCCAIATLILLPATSEARSGSWIPDVVAGLTNPGRAYRHALGINGAAHWVQYLRVVLGAPLTLLLPLSVYYWPRLSRAMRLGAIVGVGGYLAIFVAIGTNKALADATILICVLGAAAAITGRVRITRRRVLALGGAAAALIIAFLVFFSSGQFTRSGGLARFADVNTTLVNWNSPARPPDARYPALKARGAAYGPGPGQSGEISHIVFANLNNPLVSPLPRKARSAAVALSAYLTEGYYGLSLAMDQPWVPTYGVGSSYFLARNGSRILGWPSLQDRPYPMRVETHTGWDAYGHWSAFYAWIASDLSFPGTLLLLALLGRGLALAWLDTVEGSNPFAIGVFALLVLLLAYIPANNQIFQNGESAVGFVGLMALWLLTRRRVAPDTYMSAGDNLRALARRGRVGVVALLALAGGVTAALLRPGPADRYRASALVAPVGGQPGAPNSGAASSSVRQRNGQLLGELVRSPGLISQAAADAGSNLPAADISRHLKVSVGASGRIRLQVGATSAPAARSLANAIAARAVGLAGVLAKGKAAGDIPAVHLTQGAYSAPPKRLTTVSGDTRFSPTTLVVCGPAPGCGAGTRVTFPLLARHVYVMEAWVRSQDPTPARLILAVGHGVHDISTDAPQLVAHDWTRLVVGWAPRTDSESAAVAIQTAVPGAGTFEIGSITLAEAPRQIRALIDAIHAHVGSQLLAGARFARVSPARDDSVSSSSVLAWAAFGFVLSLAGALAAVRWFTREA